MAKLNCMCARCIDELLHNATARLVQNVGGCVELDLAQLTEGGDEAPAFLTMSIKAGKLVLQSHDQADGERFLKDHGVPVDG